MPKASIGYGEGIHIRATESMHLGIPHNMDMDDIRLTVSFEYATNFGAKADSDIEDNINALFIHTTTNTDKVNTFSRRKYVFGGQVEMPVCQYFDTF